MKLNKFFLAGVAVAGVATALVAAVGQSGLAKQTLNGGIRPYECGSVLLEEGKINPGVAVPVSAAMPERAESADSINVTINVTLENKNDKLRQMIILPLDVNRLGVADGQQKAAYQFRVPKGDYEIIYFGYKTGYKGQVLHYTGNLSLQTDTVLAINTADANIETPFKNVLPDGEEVKQDLWLTTPKTVGEAGNVHRGANCFFGFRHKVRDVHMTHVQFNLTYQKSKADATSVTDSRKDPTIWVNTKDIPFDFVEIYKYVGPGGIYALGYDITPAQLGDTVANTKESWKEFDIRYAEFDSVPPTAGYNPLEYQSNGLTFWHNGQQCQVSTGYAVSDTLDVRNKHWLAGNANGTGHGYDFALHPGVPFGKTGTQVCGFNALPLTLTAEGVGYLPVQYIFPGLKIWAGSDGSNYHIDANRNPRLNADASTLWGEGLAYTSFFPLKTTKADSPAMDYAIKGVNGEQRMNDALATQWSLQTRDSVGNWAEVYTNTYDKLNMLGSQFKKLAYTGPVAVELADTSYHIRGMRGRSVSRIEFDNTRTDFTAPVLNMINVRNGNDRIVSSVKRLEDALLELYATDMDGVMVSYYGYALKPGATVTAKVARHGSSEWFDIPLAERSEYENTIFWGKNYAGAMKDAGIPGVAGHYDIAVEVKDAAGNTYTLTASPAFYVEKDSDKVPLQLHLLGHIDGTRWDCAKSIAMTPDGNGSFSVTADVDGEMNGLGGFSFASAPGGDWDELNGAGDRFGAESQNVAVELNADGTEGTAALRRYRVGEDNASCGTHTLPAGKWKFNVSFASPNDVALSVVKDTDNGVGTAIAGPGAEARYYTLTGIRIDSPAPGTVCIRVQGGKAEKVVTE